MKMSKYLRYFGFIFVPWQDVKMRQPSLFSKTISGCCVSFGEVATFSFGKSFARNFYSIYSNKKKAMTASFVASDVN